MSEYNASDTRAIRKAAKAAKQAEAERRVVIFGLMSNPAGRAFMHDRLTRCHIFESSFSTDALGMAFAEGERNVGLQDLVDVMAFAPDQYIQMMREANDRSSSNRPSRPQPDPGRDPSEPDGIGSVVSDYDPGLDDNDAGLDGIDRG